MLIRFLKKMNKTVVAAAIVLASATRIPIAQSAASWNVYFNNKEGNLYQLLTYQPLEYVDNQLMNLVENNNLGIVPATVFGSTPKLLKQICQYPFNATSRGELSLFGENGAFLNDTNIEDFSQILTNRCEMYVNSKIFSENLLKILFAFDTYILYSFFLGLTIGATCGTGYIVFRCVDRCRNEGQNRAVRLPQEDEDNNVVVPSPEIELHAEEISKNKNEDSQPRKEAAVDDGKDEANDIEEQQLLTSKKIHMRHA